MEAPPRSGWPTRLSTALASRWAPPILALAAFAVSLVVQRATYPGLSWNRDEPVYLWQVEVLRAGQLSTPDGGHPDLFQPWLSAARDGTLFSQYTLGWPLVLLLGSLLGSTDLGVAAGAALAVVGTWTLVHELVRDRLVATGAAAGMLASPILVLQAGVHLNYLFTLGLGLVFLTTLHRGVRLQHRPRLVGAGALLGWIFLTRPYDAAVWGLVGCFAVLIDQHTRLRPLLRRAGWAAAGLAPLVIATLLVNHRLTGRFTQFPITVADPLDAFGFGTRRLMPGFDKIRYGPRLAAESMARNAFWLPFFLVGAHLGVVVAAAGAWWHRKQPPVRVLVALGLAFPLAYFAFFGTHVSSLTARLSGPIYYIPAFVPLCALIALAVVELGRRRPGLAAGVVVALLVVSVPVMISRLRVNHQLSQANRPWARSVEDIAEPALVVVSPPGYLLFVNPFSDNGANLDGRILYASDSGPELLELLDEHPGRTPYLQRADLSVIDLLPSEHPRTPEVLLTPMQVLQGELRLSGTVARDPGDEATARWLALDDRVLGDVVPVTTSEAIDIDVDALDLPEGLHTLQLYVGRGDDVSEAARSPFGRRTFYVRVTDGSVELLAPGTSARRVRRPGAPVAQWEDTLMLPELRVDPVPG